MFECILKYIFVVFDVIFAIINIIKPCLTLLYWLYYMSYNVACIHNTNMFFKVSIVHIMYDLLITKLGIGMLSVLLYINDILMKKVI